MKLNVTLGDAKGRTKLMDKVLSTTELILLLGIGVAMLSFLPA